MEDQSFKLIPTQTRTKIPRPLSYVVGAQMISDAWQDVPQFEFLRLWFSCDVPKALRPAKEPRLVLEVSYFRLNLGRFFPPSSMDEPSWHVHVGVCHSEEVHEMRLWLQDGGLEMGRLWLEQNAAAHGKFLHVYWRATFDENKRTFVVSHRE